jgi:hypothetical protein
MANVNNCEGAACELILGVACVRTSPLRAGLHSGEVGVKPPASMAIVQKMLCSFVFTLIRVPVIFP